MQRKISFFTFSALLVSLFVSGQRITDVYTDFNYNGTGYWHGTGASTEVANQPNDSHNVLAFTWNGITYTTGIDDSKIDAITPTISPLIKQTFRSLPVNSLPAPVSNTYVGVGVNYPVNTANTSMEYYLTDGPRGLNLGTGIYNLPGGGISRYTLQIDASTFTMPAMAVTQIGDYATNNNDEFYFVDAAGQVVGQKKIVDFDTVTAIGTGRFKFYNVTPSALVYSSTTSSDPTRDMRLVAFSLTDFGINAANMATVTQFWHKLSGNSDQAFIGAYNTAMMKVYQSVSGFVYTGGATTPNSPGYGNATVTLYNLNNEVVGTAITNPAGYYVFNDVAPGNYTIRITQPDGTRIVGSSDSGVDQDLAIIVDEEPVANTYFSLDESLPVNFGTINAKVRNGHLFVDWLTLSEVNNRGFEVELSTDGQNFQSIGSVASKAKDGNSDSQLQYTFDRTLPQLPVVLGISLLLFGGLMGANKKYRILLSSGLVIVAVVFLASSCTKEGEGNFSTSTEVYVRIKQVDIDGGFKYSKTIKAIIE